MRGGAREGAGRKPQEYSTVNYHRRVKPEWVKILDGFLKKLKKSSENGQCFLKGVMRDMGANMYCHNPECEGTLDCTECEYSEFYFE